MGNTSYVAPYTGAWIEIHFYSPFPLPPSVAPYTGAWIEIHFYGILFVLQGVAPYTGAWIEIATSFPTNQILLCRSLHGSVD